MEGLQSPFRRLERAVDALQLSVGELRSGYHLAGLPVKGKELLKGQVELNDKAVPLIMGVGSGLVGVVAAAEIIVLDGFKKCVVHGLRSSL